MNKQELVRNVANKTIQSQHVTENIINATIDVITAALVAGDKVQLVGFGSFEIRERGERVGRNPQTMEEIKIPVSKVPVFKPSKALKDAVKA